MVFEVIILNVSAMSMHSSMLFFIFKSFEACMKMFAVLDPKIIKSRENEETTVIVMPT